ncbi:MAG: hypothetical protein JXA42_15385 [Anaerolineales bacterium]|nr:hypothetical protein [Anaerolineales bacterium]
MATSEERMQILKMVADGTISAQEGSQLLKALEEGSQPRKPASSSSQPRLFIVRVTDLTTGKDKVNVRFPLGLVNVGVKMGARFVPSVEGINHEDILAAIRHGSHGRIVDITDENEGERVEIFIE